MRRFQSLIIIVLTAFIAGFYIWCSVLDRNAEVRWEDQYRHNAQNIIHTIQTVNNFQDLQLEINSLKGEIEKLREQILVLKNSGKREVEEKSADEDVERHFMGYP